MFLYSVYGADCITFCLCYWFISCLLVTSSKRFDENLISGLIQGYWMEGLLLGVSIDVVSSQRWRCLLWGEDFFAGWVSRLRSCTSPGCVHDRASLSILGEGSNPACCESRVSGGSRAAARCPQCRNPSWTAEGPAVTPKCSSGRRLAPQRKRLLCHQHRVWSSFRTCHTQTLKNGEEFLAGGEGCHMCFSLLLTAPLSRHQIMCKYWLYEN